MNGTARDSERILEEARRSLDRQRGDVRGQQRGGQHRDGQHRDGRRGSIGRRSAEMKRRHWTAKLVRIALAVCTILAATMVTGLVIDGIGFGGIMATAMAIVAAVWVLARYPRLSAPDLSQLNTGNVRQMVGRTELWLEAQRPALPAPAMRIVDDLGAQLDTLGQQLEGIDPAQPAVAEVRKLVCEHLPGTIASWQRIPAHLRREDHGGATPDAQLTDALGKISAEIDDVTRRLAAGDLDNLAIRTRYLDYRYGNGVGSGLAGLNEPENPV